MVEMNASPNSREVRAANVEIWTYDKALGVGTWWEDDARVLIEDDSGGVVISGNRAGLRSLARHLLTLADESVPAGRHFDFDWYGGGLDEGSRELRIEVED